ncbi:MAG TPA: RDD family protein [Acidimicrobiia bacterium]|nr:RDD family protein [Acidimicrobiia bacterium]
MVEDDRTHYDVLGIEPDAAKNEIKRAYQEHLEAAQGAGDAETTLRIRRAWQVLSDPVQRSRYDESVGVTRGGRRIAPESNGSASGGHADGVEILDDDGDEEEPEAEAPGREVEVARDWRGRPRPDRPARPRREPPPPPPMAEGLELPTLGRRLAGDAVDVITLIALGYAAYGLGAVASGGAGFAIFAGAAALAVFLYVVIPVSRTGQTLGKRMTYTMVVDRLSGTLLTPRQILIRYSIPTLLALTIQFAPIAVMLGFTYAFGPHQISLLDRMSKSVVVVARYQPVRPGRTVDG